MDESPMNKTYETKKGFGFVLCQVDDQENHFHQNVRDEGPILLDLYYYMVQ